MIEQTIDLTGILGQVTSDRLHREINGRMAAGGYRATSIRLRECHVRALAKQAGLDVVEDEITAIEPMTVFGFPVEIQPEPDLWPRTAVALRGDRGGYIYIDPESRQLWGLKVGAA